jgi:CRP/FNR family transcriptional regulator, anaerobic regulatory protein
MDTSALFHSVLRKEVESFGTIKTFEAGSSLLHENGYIQYIPISLKGVIRVTRTEEDGRELLLYYIQPGESCIMSFLGGIHQDTSKVNAIVEEDAEILLIPVQQASDWVKKFPEWTDYIFKLYHKRFEELLSVVNAVAFRQLDDRVLHLLRQKAAMFKSNEIKITHQQLADELGSTREVVSRIVKNLEHEGVVTLSRNKITLL